MKKLISILLGVVGVFVLAIVAVFFFTADMVRSADEFFTAVKDKDIDNAYLYLSEDFKSNISKSELERYLTNNSLDEYKDASWESRSINGGRGSLIGSVTTETGGVVPVTLNFVKGEDGWKIYSIQKPSPGFQDEITNVEIPSPEEQVELVSKSMYVFAESVNAKSMERFRSHVSRLWQKQFTVEKFDEAFKSFYELGVDLTVLDNFSPQFSSTPSIDEFGVLVIAGSYPTEPKQVHFEQKYIYEGLDWKLMGFSVNIK